MKELSYSAFLPVYETKIGALAGTYDCDYGNTAISVVGTTLKEFLSYNEALKARNAVLYAENTIADNRFMTYLLENDGKEYMVHLCYYPIRGNARVVWGERKFLPTLDDAVFGSGTGRTSILQYSRNGVYNSQPATGAPGMAYIITLADGTFVVIDGGPRQKDKDHFTKKKENGVWVDGEFTDENDCDKLYRMLRERTPAGQKPVIAVWMITHGHSDHTDLAGDFLGKYGKDVEVRIAGYNLADPLLHPTKNEKNEILSITRAYIQKRFAEVGAVHWNIHTGQRMSLPGCEIEILHTHEDYFPKPYAWLNHTGAAFRLKFKGKTFMVLGDCESDINNQMAYKYGKALKSDILQITHHGANGGCTSLNAVVDPDICLWPVDAYRFYDDARMLGFQSGYECNWVLRNDEFRVRTHYHNCEDVEIFTDEA